MRTLLLNNKIILFLFLLTINSKTCFSQNIFYDLFAKEGTEWSIGETSSVSPPWTVDEVYYLRLQGEEIIEDNLYHKLVKINGLNGNEIGVFEYLRIDQDSVLYLRDLNGEEEKIFDYSLCIGDTLILDSVFFVYRGNILYFNDWVFPDMIIEDTSYINLSDTIAKSWIFCGYEEWTSLIGSKRNMLDVYQLYVDFVGYTTSLLCVFFNGEKIYQNPYFDFCDDTFIGNLNTNPELFLYPNPTGKYLRIKTNSNTFKSNYKIINQLGEVVGCGRIEENIQTINIENIDAGYYFLKTQNKVYKFVKLKK